MQVSVKRMAEEKVTPNKRLRSPRIETWEVAYAFLRSYSSSVMHPYEVFFLNTTDSQARNSHYVHITMWRAHMVCCLQTENMLTAIQIPIEEVKRAAKECQLLLKGQLFQKIVVRVPCALPVICEEHVYEWTCGTKFLSEIQKNACS